MAGTYKAFNSYGNSLRAMRNNPQFQELEQAQSSARSLGRNGSSYSVNPSTRVLSSKMANAEANRIRSLDEFGIQNRLAQEALGFNKNIHNSRLAMDLKALRNERDALKDARRGANLGMIIGLGQTGLDYYDRNQERQRMADQAEQQELRNLEYLAALRGYSSPEEMYMTEQQGPSFDPSYDHKRMVGQYERYAQPRSLGMSMGLAGGTDY